MKYGLYKLCPKQNCYHGVQARDVEASLQEQLLEQFHDLVLARAVAAGSTGRSHSALAAAAEAAELLRPILAVLLAAGAAGSACLGRACGALHAKKRLKGKATAVGLQTIIQQLAAQGEQLHAASVPVQQTISMVCFAVKLGVSVHSHQLLQKGNSLGSSSLLTAQSHACMCQGSLPLIWSVQISCANISQLVPLSESQLQGNLAST